MLEVLSVLWLVIASISSQHSAQEESPKQASYADLKGVACRILYKIDQLLGEIVEGNIFDGLPSFVRSIVSTIKNHVGLIADKFCGEPITGLSIQEAYSHRLNFCKVATKVGEILVKAPELVKLIAPNNDRLNLLAQRAVDLGEKLLQICVKMAAADSQYFNFSVPEMGRSADL